MITRYAIVRSNVTSEKVATYLPSNYKVIWEGKTDWHYSPHTCVWKQFSGLVDNVVVIEGKDRSGWTLDKYVSPRLGFGMMRCDECDLSHPIMKQIAVRETPEPSLKKFKVRITRTEYQRTEITVEAESMEDAEQVANDEVTSDDFETYNADQSIESVIPV